MSISSINSSASNIYSQGLAQSANQSNETTNSTSAQSTTQTVASSDSVSISSEAEALSKATNVIQLQPYDVNKFLTEDDKQLLGLPTSDMMTSCMAQAIASLRESGALTGKITGSTVYLGPMKLPTDLYSMFAKEDLPKMANLKNRMEKNFALMHQTKASDEQEKFNVILNMGNDSKTANASLMAKRLKSYGLS